MSSVPPTSTLSTVRLPDVLVSDAFPIEVNAPSNASPADVTFTSPAVSTPPSVSLPPDVIATSLPNVSAPLLPVMSPPDCSVAVPLPMR